MTKTYIYTSPDGGRTVYQNESGKKEKTLISQDDFAKAKELIEEEVHMTGWPGIAIRKKYPALQEAWNQYATLWKLTVTDEDLNADYDD
tara:strand:+ start:292 stop:558 length:267 start_codon:yes stop_codon:yes gene_type:complete